MEDQIDMIARHAVEVCHNLTNSGLGNAEKLRLIHQASRIFMDVERAIYTSHDKLERLRVRNSRVEKAA